MWLKTPTPPPVLSKYKYKRNIYRKLLTCHLRDHCPMKRRQLLFRVPVQHLLICIFVSPCFPNWEHVLRALETFISFGVSFSSFFLSLTRRRVFGVSSESNKETNWIFNFLFLQFSGEDTTSPCPWFVQRMENRRTYTPILGRFLSCSSVWQGYQVLGVLIMTVIRIWGTNWIFFLVIFSLTRPRVTLRNGIQGTCATRKWIFGV